MVILAVELQFLHFQFYREGIFSLPFLFRLLFKLFLSCEHGAGPPHVRVVCEMVASFVGIGITGVRVVKCVNVMSTRAR